MMLTKQNNGYATLNDLLDDFLGYGQDESHHYPAVNLRYSDEEAVVSVDLPGVERESIQISVEKGKYLKLTAERKSEEPREGERDLVRESVTGSFRRIVELPFRIDHDKTEAHHANGVLTVRLARSEEEKPRQIDIRGE